MCSTWNGQNRHCIGLVVYHRANDGINDGIVYLRVNANTEQTHLGTMTFRSDIYSFEDDCVYFERKDGFVNNNTGVKYSLVLFDDRHHYMVLQGNE